jgi:hypothetical protein
MATSRGKAQALAHITSTPKRMEPVLRGAARAGARVVVDDIKERTPSDAVRKDVRMRTQSTDDQIKVTIDVKPGWGRSVGIWLEWGTSPHFISVDESQRQGRSVGRINQLSEEHGASLVIGGSFVGKTVWHPGASPHPAFRPAIDAKEAEAISTAQAFIDRHVKRSGIIGADEGSDE